MKASRTAGLCALSILALVSCGAPHESYAQYGAMLARDPTIAQSRYNQFTCLTCHAEHASDTGAAIYPGAPLEGAALRPSWWGGRVLDLHAAVDICFEHFMQGAPLDPNSDTAQALDAYLMQLAASAPAAQTTAVPFTVPESICDLAPADTTHGEDLYNHACSTCHGAKHTGPTIDLANIIPDDTLSAHLAQYGAACTRDIFIEKIRHGSFLGYPGHMPPFSTQTLSDQDVADLLAYLEAPTGGTCTGTPACM